jgi:hypothetical protein
MRDVATALLALWNDVDPAFDEQYNRWHADEHVPERLTVPGILWGHRYGTGAGERMPRYLTLYGLQSVDVLESEAYRQLLDQPTPMSRTMRPRLRNVSRWVCKLHEQTDLDKAAHLAVRVLADMEPPPTGRDPEVDLHVVGGRLLAERLPQARPLPWLQATQDQGIEGRWLVCVPLQAGAGSDGSTAGVTVYGQLPVRRCQP